MAGVRTAGVAGEAAGVRVLPVDVDAVEDVGPTRVVDQIVAGVGEGGRVRAALPKPPDQVQPPKDHRILRFGLLALSLRSWLKLPRSGWSQVSAHAVDGLFGGVGHVVVGVTITDGALAALDVAERVVDVGDLRGAAGGHHVLDVVVAVVDAPLGEVAELDLVAGRGARVRAAAGGPDGDRAADRSGLVGRVTGLETVTSSWCPPSGRCSCTSYR